METTTTAELRAVIFNNFPIVVWHCMWSEFVGEHERLICIISYPTIDNTNNLSFHLISFY